ncbi:hypothetical protein SS50377_24678 [Spironucleus salmonicida]|uniref:Uncharacterized protein n=1 Tax=Spironucleus salmonicida TaxID=348837 RepID=V6LIV0_9EUKA|nr:hypothetical protein SS50377_24678 [Spironucleus salmonicida]|eukprot:EST44487.1 hypothetical protein SS50377_15484 [Spironucleus salmonicida]
MSINVHVYIGDGYSFFMQISTQQSIQQLMQIIQIQLNHLFVSSTDFINVHGLLDSNFCDLCPSSIVQHILPDQAPVITLLDLAGPQSGLLQLHQISPHPQSQILNAVLSTLSDKMKTDLVQARPEPFPMAQIQVPQASRKCSPYCQPLAPFREVERCGCGEIKSYAVSEGPLCTEHCKTADQRKQKASACEFCSICMSRYRNSKYVKGSMHQCKACHRPWLLLNTEGVCRSCHCEGVQNQHAPFRQANIDPELQK